MSTFTSSGDGRKEVLVGQPLSCPKCHAPLDASKLRGSQAGWLAPLWLRLLVLVLILAALTGPLAAGYYIRSRALQKTAAAEREVMDSAAAAARKYLDTLLAKDLTAARNMMSEGSKNQFGSANLQSVLEVSQATYEITATKPNQRLVDVIVTIMVPQDAKLPKLPVEVDKHPRFKLAMGPDEDGQWRVDGVSLLPKEGTNALADYGPMKAQPPVAGGTGVEAPKKKK